jgi:hypothetical protein
LRERSLRYLFPDISTRAHLEHTVRLAASGRVRLAPTITHVLPGITSVPRAFEITANKGAHKAINPAQVMMHAQPGDANQLSGGLEPLGIGPDDSRVNPVIGVEEYVPSWRDA